MRFQNIMTALVFVAFASAQSSVSGPGTTPIDITGPNMTPPPATPTIETQSPRPSLSASSVSAAPTETFPSITGNPSSAPTETFPSISGASSATSATGIIGSLTSRLGSLTSSIAATTSSLAPSSSPNAGVAVQLDSIAGWSIVALAGGVIAGAALV